MKTNISKRIASVFVISFFLVLAAGSLSTADINDEQAVTKAMQGTWVGNDHEGASLGVYTHYKLIVSGNNFMGWLMNAYTIDEPSWPSQPDETGTFSLSPVQGYTNSAGKFRNINFYKEGGGYGDNSLTARAFTNMIIYDESGGMYIVGWAPMTKK